MVVVLLSCAVVVLALLICGLLVLLCGFSRIYTKMEKRALLAEEALARAPVVGWQTFTVPTPTPTPTGTYQS